MSDQSEWRACAEDIGDRAPDASPWHPTRQEAESEAANFGYADPPFHRIWIEYRTVSLPTEWIDTRTEAPHA